jgi:flagellar biosynthesis protein FlhG
MDDQAERLREKVKTLEDNKRTKTLAIISGKGGVGKSNFALNFAISLKEKGNSVLLFDMDVGMGNIDILMGISTPYSIIDFFTSAVSLKQLIGKAPVGIDYITGGSGLTELTKINENDMKHFFNEFSIILNEYDYVLLDMGAGMDETSLRFVLSVDEVIVLTTSEPTSITDAYAAMKYIIMKNNQIPFYLLVNRASSEKEGIDTYTRISNVLKHFLGKSSELLGVLPEDKTISLAVKIQTPFFVHNTRSPASKALMKITEKYCHKEESQLNNSKVNFITKLKRFLHER